MISNYMNNLNYLDKSWVYNQYDSTVMGDTIKEPGQSAGVVKIHNSEKAIGASTDCNPLYIRINPEKGMMYTVLEAYRNLLPLILSLWQSQIILILLALLIQI